MKNLFFYDTIIGRIGIMEEDNKIINVFFDELDNIEDAVISETSLLKEASNQLMDYFQGKRKSFDLPICYTRGTEFQKNVWKALETIPYGETRTYKEIAELIGNPKASRAVGGANNKNQIAIFIPCHRVIGSNGKLVGYAGGVDIKEKLLILEKSYR